MLAGRVYFTGAGEESLLLPGNHEALIRKVLSYVTYEMRAGGRPEFSIVSTARVIASSVPSHERGR
jgi:hypothetical protein